MVSQDGQEKIISDALALCPSEKLTWSTGESDQRSQRTVVPNEL